jgi:hypothetical protein
MSALSVSETVGWVHVEANTKNSAQMIRLDLYKLYDLLDSMNDARNPSETSEQEVDANMDCATLAEEYGQWLKHKRMINTFKLLVWFEEMAWD